MAGTYCIKEEPREESSNEHPILEVKTEPYNITVFAGQDEIGYNHHSTSQDATASTSVLHINDEPTDICDPISLDGTSAGACFNIGATTVQPPFANSVPVTTNGHPTDPKPRGIAPDQMKNQETGKSSIRDHEKDTLYRCTVCLATCTEIAHLEVHLKTHETKPFTHGTHSATFQHMPAQASPICSVHVHVGNDSEQHLTMSRGEQRLRYDLCPSTSSPTVCAKDRKVHTKKPYKCDLCPAAFSRKTHLQDHRHTHTREKPYKCDLCPAEFGRSTRLRVHKQTHTAGEKPYKCDVCPAGFRESAHLRCHKRTHTGEKPFKCDICPARFSQSANLRRHEQAHTGEKPYKCNLCPAEFGRKMHLQDHKHTHTREKPHKCDICHAEFSQRTYLQRHKQIHTDEKPHKCNLCPATFIRSTHLKRHKQTHTGEKPCKCDLCPAEFSDCAYLQCHKQTHMGEKPYKCDRCSAGFIQSAHLRRHKQTHTGEKPYKCDICTAEFSQSTHLERHKHTHRRYAVQV